MIDTPAVRRDDAVPGAGRIPRLFGAALRFLIRVIGPIVLALLAGGLLLQALGRNPLTFYADLVKGAVQYGEWQDTIIRMAPLTFIALAMIFAFRAAIWNLGIDGQFILAAAILGGVAPSLVRDLPLALAFVLLFLIAGAVGAAWAFVPAVLKARYQTSEIITSLMMTFIAINFANILIKGPFVDPSEAIQTHVLTHLLPGVAGTRIHVGVLAAIGLAVISAYVLRRTAFGLRIDVLGQARPAALHAGIRVAKVTIVVFMLSGALAGMAAACEVLGVLGYVRADWNPAFGLQVVPFVFLARLNPIAVLPYLAFFAVLTIGGQFATVEAGLPTDFLLVLTALILLFMTVIEYLGRRGGLGASYVTPGLKRGLRAPLAIRRRESD